MKCETEHYKVRLIVHETGYYEFGNVERIIFRFRNKESIGREAEG